MSVIDTKDRVKCALTADITASQTLLPVGPGGQDFQAVSGHATMAVIRDAERSETVKVTGVSFGVLTVERGQDGSTPRAFKLGAIVSMRPVESTLAQYQQKGVMRQVAYNPNAVLMPAYFGEKVAETGVEGCTHRIWHNVVQDEMSWRLTYGAPCKDLTNWRDWNWYAVEIPWPWWPWTPPEQPEKLPALWIDASVYQYADGDPVSLETYPAGVPEFQNPVTELVSGSLFYQWGPNNYGQLARFKTAGINGLNSFQLEKTEWGTVDLDNWDDTPNVVSPSKTVFWIIKPELFDENNPCQTGWYLYSPWSSPSNSDDGLFLYLENYSDGMFEIWFDVNTTMGYEHSISKYIPSTSDTLLISLRYDVSNGRVEPYINGVGQEINPDVDYEHYSGEYQQSHVMTEYALGMEENGRAQFGEFKVYDSWLSDTDLSNQHELLKKKWGIA